jgi:hypothetical protein
MTKQPNQTVENTNTKKLILRQHTEAHQAVFQGMWKEFLTDIGDNSGGRQSTAQDFYSFVRNRYKKIIDELQDK